MSKPYLLKIIELDSCALRIVCETLSADRSRLHIEKSYRDALGTISWHKLNEIETDGRNFRINSLEDALAAFLVRGDQESIDIETVETGRRAAHHSAFAFDDPFKPFNAKHQYASEWHRGYDDALAGVERGEGEWGPYSAGYDAGAHYMERA